MTFEKTRSRLPLHVQALIPEENIEYYKYTDAMHCNLESLGGSKFLGVKNILHVLESDCDRIAAAVKERIDDRTVLLRFGARHDTFLPAVPKNNPHPKPAALYYKVDGVRGKLGIVALAALHPTTKVLVRREKSLKDTSGREIVPCSFTVVRGTLEDLPYTDFATVVVGRAAGGTRDELWTIHPGAPIRTTLGDFIEGSENLPAPEEGTRQKVMVATAGDLLASGKMTPSDHIKIVPGDFERMLKQYEIVS
ncbi:MAG: hypothetical protein HY470_00845 [Candidatus Ryanbacteria bacterium]|nr:hypothetical protein [Candidatus Ryanbacteria bacterium]